MFHFYRASAIKIKRKEKSDVLTAAIDSIIQPDPEKIRLQMVIRIKSKSPRVKVQDYCQMNFLKRDLWWPSRTWISISTTNSFFSSMCCTACIVMTIEDLDFHFYDHFSSFRSCTACSRKDEAWNGHWNTNRNPVLWSRSFQIQILICKKTWTLIIQDFDANLGFHIFGNRLQTIRADFIVQVMCVQPRLILLTFLGCIKFC